MQINLQRLKDTLSKYDEKHTITKIEVKADYLEIELNYASTKKKSQTITSIKIFKDDYFGDSDNE